MLGRKRVLPLCFLVVVGWEAGAHAQEAPTATSTVTAQADAEPLSYYAEYRFWTSVLDDFALDAAGTPYQTDWRGFHRLRAGGAYRTDFGLDLVLEADVLADSLYGDVTPLGGHLVSEPVRQDFPFHRANLIPRNAYLAYLTPIGQLRAGLMTSSWGLGMLANSGDDRADVLGTRSRGDVVLRAALITTPLAPFMASPSWADHLYLALSGDRVFVDSNANWLEGDEAYQGIAAILYRHEGSEAGLYGVLRDQNDDDGDTLTAQLADITARHELAVGDSPVQRSRPAGLLDR
jgi:hypothetical protein